MAGNTINFYGSMLLYGKMHNPWNEETAFTSSSILTSILWTHLECQVFLCYKGRYTFSLKYTQKCTTLMNFKFPRGGWQCYLVGRTFNAINVTKLTGWNTCCYTATLVHRPVTKAPGFLWFGKNVQNKGSTAGLEALHRNVQNVQLLGTSVRNGQASISFALFAAMHEYCNFMLSVWIEESRMQCSWTNWIFQTFFKYACNFYTFKSGFTPHTQLLCDTHFT